MLRRADDVTISEDGTRPEAVCRLQPLAGSIMKAVDQGSRATMARMNRNPSLDALRIWIAERIAHETEALQRIRSAGYSSTLVANDEREALLARYASALLTLDEYDEFVKDSAL